jgi:hypothetical protein
MSEELITPAALANLLQSLYSTDVHAGRDRADLEMLRDLSRARCDDPLV